MHDIQPSSPTATDVFPTEDSSSQAEDCSFTRPHLNSGSSGVGSSESSHYSPSGSPLQHSPDVWTEKGEKEINPSVWSNGTLGTQVWKPLEDHEVCWGTMRYVEGSWSMLRDHDVCYGIVRLLGDHEVCGRIMRYVGGSWSLLEDHRHSTIATENAK